MSPQLITSLEKRDVMTKTIPTLGFLLVVIAARTFAEPLGEPIKPHPDKPHYYLFNGHPTILITSAEISPCASNAFTE